MRAFKGLGFILNMCKGLLFSAMRIVLGIIEKVQQDSCNPGTQLGNF